MEQFDIVGIYTGSSVPPYSSRIEAITSEAVSNSSRYILAELEVAIATTLDLLSALTKFNRDGRSQRACARPALAVNDSCVDIAPLFDSVASAQSILALLTTLRTFSKVELTEVGASRRWVCRGVVLRFRSCSPRPWGRR